MTSFFIGICAFLLTIEASAKLLHISQASALKESWTAALDDRASTALGLKDGETVCADGEGKNCQCDGEVFFGLKFFDGKPGAGRTTTFERLKQSPHKRKAVSGSIKCSVDSFGGQDPLPGYYKYCMCTNRPPEADPKCYKGLADGGMRACCSPKCWTCGLHSMCNDNKKFLAITGNNNTD